MIAINENPVANEMSAWSPPGLEENLEGLDTEGSGGWGPNLGDSVLVRHETRTVVEVVRRINNNRYIMDPDFQREFLWTETMQSRLIESALMRIPLPVLYLAEQEDGRTVVVDGLQRLTTFQRFLNDELKLKLDGKEFDKKRFKDLAPKYQNWIEDTNLILYLIDSKVPEQVKLDIFERVNSGAPLSRQQMRNCIYVGAATRWLRAEAQSEEFLEATGRNVNSKTMRDRELINRFCAFYLLGVENYRDDMDAFLAQALMSMNKMSQEQLQDLSARFRTSMTNNTFVFQSHAFRKHTASDVNRSVLNASLFDVFSTLMARYSIEQIRNAAEQIRRAFFGLMDDTTFVAAISLGTNQENNVRTRYHLVENMMRRAVEEASDAHTR